MALSLEAERHAFSQRRLLAMPIAGVIAWSAVGLYGMFLSPPNTAWSAWILFIATGSIMPLGLSISRLTGENLTDLNKPKNSFDSLFYSGLLAALLVYAIALPFFVEEPSSLPLSVGILTGLMWPPLSWIINHWVGYFHSISRTVMVFAAWYIFPTHRFVAIPIVIVAIYLITIVVLEKRWRALQVQHSEHSSLA